MIAFLVGVLIVLAAIWVYYFICKRDLVRLREYERATDTFFAAARPLLQDDETPMSVIDMIDTLNRHIDDPRAARHILIAARRTSRLIESDDERLIDKEIADFTKRRQELGKQLARAIKAGFLAMSYRSRFWGPQLRLWMSSVETLRREVEVATIFHEQDWSRGHMSRRLAAANP